MLTQVDIEDLVQEILLSVHAVRATYDPERPFVPWLLAITRNRLADAARRHARTTAHEIHVENLAVTFGDNLTNTNMDSNHNVTDLRKAIEALPPIQRDAIARTPFDGRFELQGASLSGLQRFLNVEALANSGVVSKMR